MNVLALGGGLGTIDILSIVLFSVTGAILGMAFAFGLRLGL